MQKRKSIGFLLSALGGAARRAADRARGHQHGHRMAQLPRDRGGRRGQRRGGRDPGRNRADDAGARPHQHGAERRGTGRAPAPDAIKARRAEMRKAMAAGWPVLSRLPYLVEDGSMRKAEAAVAAIDALRERADQAIQRPRAERDASVQQQWYATLTQGIEAITDVWQGATQRLSGLDPKIAALNDVKFLAALMREYAGRERALLGAGKPIEPEKRLDVADWRARVGLTWEQINSIFPKATAPAAITAAVAAVNERFFGKYLPVRDKAYQNLDRGEAARPERQGMVGRVQSRARCDRRHSRCRDRDRRRAPAGKPRRRAAVADRELRPRADRARPDRHGLRRRAQPRVHAARADRRGAEAHQRGQARRRIRQDAAQRRDRRDQRCAHPVPRPEPAHARDRAAARRKRAQGRRRAQGRDAPACRRVPGRGRRHRQHRLDHRRPAGERRRHAHQDRRDHPAAFRHGDERLGRGLGQCAVGGDSHRGADIVGAGDRPAGARVRAGSPARRCGRPKRPTRASPPCRRRPAASATW